jgi:hypothetical protein
MPRPCSAFHPGLLRFLGIVALTDAAACQSPTDPLADYPLTSIQVEGSLVWNDGSPIPGVLVEAWEITWDSHRVLASALSGAAGQYAVRWTERCKSGGLALGLQIGQPPGVGAFGTCTGNVSCTSAPQRRDCVFQR